jgi:hypothetical protein
MTCSKTIEWTKCKERVAQVQEIQNTGNSRERDVIRAVEVTL